MVCGAAVGEFPGRRVLRDVGAEEVGAFCQEVICRVDREKIMLRKLLLMVGVCVLILPGCSTVRVSQDYRSGRDFSGLRTYRWQPQGDEKKARTTPDDPLVSERIRNAVDRILSSRGFREESTDPDIFIDYRYTVRQVIESDDYGPQVGVGTYGWRSGVFGGIGIGSGGYVHTSEEGVLLIDFMDPQSGELLWRGKGTHYVEEHWSPETKTGKINELTEKTLAQFPPVKNP
jgi:hypothetical protein